MALIAAIAVGIPVAALGLGGIGKSTTGLAPERMRSELAGSIVQRWSPYVKQRYGVAASGWDTRMLANMRRADIANLESAASAATFEQMNAALLGAGMGVANVQGGTQLAKLGAAGEDLVYTPLTSCRIVDTRIVGGPVAANGTRSFKAYTTTDFTSQGGAASHCNLPANVSALTVKITSVYPSGDGYFTAYPFNDPKPLASSLNYTNGMILSDETHIRLCRPGCPSEFNVYSFAASDLVIDVTGYFIEPEATALECTVAQETGNLDLLSGLQHRDVQCPTGYAATGGGCGGPLGIAIANSEPMVVAGQSAGWKCDMVGSLLSMLSYKVSATCCRVPGR